MRSPFCGTLLSLPLLLLPSSFSAFVRVPGTNLDCAHGAEDPCSMKAAGGDMKGSVSDCQARCTSLTDCIGFVRDANYPPTSSSASCFMRKLAANDFVVDCSKMFSQDSRHDVWYDSVACLGFAKAASTNMVLPSMKGGDMKGSVQECTVRKLLLTLTT